MHMCELNSGNKIIPIEQSNDDVNMLIQFVEMDIQHDLNKTIFKQENNILNAFHSVRVIYSIFLIIIINIFVNTVHVQCSK